LPSATEFEEEVCVTMIVCVLFAAAWHLVFYWSVRFRIR